MVLHWPFRHPSNFCQTNSGSWSKGPFVNGMPPAGAPRWILLSTSMFGQMWMNYLLAKGEFPLPYRVQCRALRGNTHEAWPRFCRVGFLAVFEGSFSVWMKWLCFCLILDSFLVWMKRNTFFVLVACWLVDFWLFLGRCLNCCRWPEHGHSTSWYMDTWTIIFCGGLGLDMVLILMKQAHFSREGPCLCRWPDP